MNYNSNSQPFGATAIQPPQPVDSQPWPVHSSGPQPKKGSGPPTYVSAPPPLGYPGMNGVEGHYPNANYKLETKRKGDGFWKGCFAALCCCCVLDACF